MSDGISEAQRNVERAEMKKKAPEIVEAAREFYRKKLKEYGSFEKITSPDVGLAPAAWRELTKFLQDKGYLDEEITTAKVAITNAIGRVYDRHRGKLITDMSDPDPRKWKTWHGFE